MKREACKRSLLYRSLLPAVALLSLTLTLAGCGDGDKDADQALEEARQQVEAATADLINQSFTVSATALNFPYTPPDERYAPEPGYKYALVTVTVRNTGEFPVVAASSGFSLEMDNGKFYQPSILIGLDDDFGAARSPIPGSEESGTIAFEVPETALPVSLWQEIGPEKGEVLLPAPST